MALQIKEDALLHDPPFYLNNLQFYIYKTFLIELHDFPWLFFRPHSDIGNGLYKNLNNKISNRFQPSSNVYHFFSKSRFKAFLHTLTKEYISYIDTNF